MRASTVMAVACLLYAVHRWAKGKTVLTAEVAVSAAFAILVIAMLDTGKTEEIAKGFAWLFLVAAAYNAVPDLSKAAKAKPKKAATKPTKPIAV